MKHANLLEMKLNSSAKMYIFPVFLFFSKYCEIQLNASIVKCSAMDRNSGSKYNKIILIVFVLSEFKKGCSTAQP